MDLINNNDESFHLLNILNWIMHCLNIYLYPKNIILETNYGKNLVFLDTNINITPFQFISTSIYEKMSNLHIYLHNLSNNPFDMKSSIFISQLLRGIIICDNINDYYVFRDKFIKRMILRGFHPAIIRKILNNKNIPKYKYRYDYIEKIMTNKQNKIFNIIFNTHYLTDPDKYWLSDYNIEQLQERLLEIKKDDNDEILIYFKKVYQKLFDDDDKLRRILWEMIKLLPTQFNDIIKPRICNKVNIKIRKYLS